MLVADEERRALGRDLPRGLRRADEDEPDRASPGARAHDEALDAAALSARMKLSSSPSVVQLECRGPSPPVLGAWACAAGARTANGIGRTLRSVGMRRGFPVLLVETPRLGALAPTSRVLAHRAAVNGALDLPLVRAGR